MKMTSHPHRSKAAQHTATLKPWSYHEINYVRGAIHDAAGIDIVEHVTREIGEEILHAVNRAALFDELVAALKKAAETLRILAQIPLADGRFERIMAERSAHLDRRASIERQLFAGRAR